MFVCHTRHGWGVIVMGKNVIGVREGSFLTVKMDQCKDITGGPFEHVTPAGRGGGGGLGEEGGRWGTGGKMGLDLLDLRDYIM